jgi:hypothetical protein
VQLRFDGPREPVRRIIEVDALYRGRLDADDVHRALVELGDPFANAHQHFVRVRLRLRTCDSHRAERERQCHCARQHNGFQQFAAPQPLRSAFVRPHLLDPRACHCIQPMNTDHSARAFLIGRERVRSPFGVYRE